MVVARFRSELDAEHARMALAASGIHARAVGAMGQMLAPFNPTQTVDLLIRRAAYGPAVAELTRLASDLSRERLHCPGCDYSLVGLHVATCPECGLDLRQAAAGAQPWTIAPISDAAPLVSRVGQAIGWSALGLIALGTLALVGACVAWLAGVL